MNRYALRKDRGVSPVVATILLVAITVILAAIIWLWISGVISTGKEYNGNVDMGQLEVGNDYLLIVSKAPSEETSVQYVEMRLILSDGTTFTSQLSDPTVYGNSGSHVQFNDVDTDGLISLNDEFRIAKQVDLDGNGLKSSQNAEFRLVHTPTESSMFSTRI